MSSSLADLGCLSRFRIARRSAALFCVSIVFIAVGSLDVGAGTGKDHKPRRGTNRKIQERPKIELESSSNSSASKLVPALEKSCGPPQLTGTAELGSTFTKWLPWSQVRTGTTCIKVHFRKPFTNVNDIRLFVTADRTRSERNGHLTPVVWAEKIQLDGFQACVHFNSDYHEEPTYWKEKLVISWWALDTDSRPDDDGRYLGRVMTTLEHNSSVCIRLPEEVNPHSNTVLVSTSHPGIMYEKHYSHEATTHTPRESVISWIDERTNNTFEVCTKRLYEKTPGKIEGAGVDVLSVRRNKRYSGLTKIWLGDYGRGCVYVDSDLMKVGSADDGTSDMPMVFVQTRLNKEDREKDGRSPQVTAWVEQKLARGFTVCAKNLARGSSPAKHTIQIHWIAMHEVPRGLDSSLCREGNLDT